MANISRLQAEEQLKEKTAECEALRDDLNHQIQYGNELKRGVLGYKEQKKVYLEKIAYLTKKVHGEAVVDGGFELRKVTPLVDAGVQCENSVHDAVFGRKDADVNTSASMGKSPSPAGAPLSPRNAVEDDIAPSRSSPPRVNAAATAKATTAEGNENSPMNATKQCNQQ